MGNPGLNPSHVKGLKNVLVDQSQQVKINDFYIECLVYETTRSNAISYRNNIDIKYMEWIIQMA